MIIGLTGYHQKGNYSPSIFSTISLLKMIEQGHEDNDLIYEILLLRNLSLDFFKDQSGWLNQEWVNINGNNSYHLTYYNDMQGFIDCNLAYRSNKDIFRYIDLKNQFLQKYSIEFIEYGVINSNNYIDYDFLLDCVENNLYQPWPEELSYKIIV
jgi:hypothetical protein